MITAFTAFALLSLSTASPLARRQADGACADTMVIFARGTTEQAPVGTIVGPPLQDALQQASGGGTVSVEGVDYPANIAGFLAGGDAQGSEAMAQLVTQTATNCPNARIVMSGYSQGGQLVHNAAEQLDATTASKVSSAVIFGDPNNPDPVANIPADRTRVFCADGDLICEGQAIVRAPHLSYGDDAPAAAEFIMSQSAVASTGTATGAGASNSTGTATGTGAATGATTAAGGAGGRGNGNDNNNNDNNNNGGGLFGGLFGGNNANNANN